VVGLVCYPCCRLKPATRIAMMHGPINIRNICTWRQEEIAEWKKMPNVKLHYLRFSPNPIRIIGTGKDISNSSHK